MIGSLSLRKKTFLFQNNVYQYHHGVLNR